MDSVTHLNFNKHYTHLQNQQIELIKEFNKRGIYQKIILHANNKTFYDKIRWIENLDIYLSSFPTLSALVHSFDSKILLSMDKQSLKASFWLNFSFNIPYIITKLDERKIKRSFFQNLYYKRAKAIFTPSEFIASDILFLPSIKEADIKIVPYMVSTYKKNERFILGIRHKFKEHTIFGVIAPFSEDFDYSSLVEVASIYETRHQKTHFIFIGNGPQLSKVQQKAKGLSNITFITNYDNIYEYISIFDLFLYPARSNGYNPILLDVMNQEVTILASKAGSIPELIKHHKNGEIFPALTTSDIVESIDCLKHEKDLLAKYRKNSYHTLLEHTPAIIANRYIEVIFGE